MDPLLRQSGLFGRGLVPVDTPEGVARYNAALDECGIAPTQRDRFYIDGGGWSWEIAEEKGNPDYLGHGAASRIAIIATPEQYKKPLHRPTFSFKRHLLNSIFERHMREFADMTTTTCVTLGIEQRVLDTVKDLLALDSIVVVASAGKLMEAAQHQRKLVTTFVAPGLAWYENDGKLRQELIESAKAHGDLQRRRTEIPDFLFSLIGNFWTRAFGGVFVLRAGADNILVVEDEEQLPERSRGGERYRAFHLGQRKELIAHLLEEDLLEFDIERFRDPAALEDIEALERYLMADTVCRLEPECDYESMTPSKRKGILHAHKGEVPEVLAELQRFILQSKIGGAPKVSPDLKLLLLRPNARLVGDLHQGILWMLLQRMQENPPNVLHLYQFDKEGFFARFEGWSAAKKRWTVKHVSERYQPEMDR